MGRDHVSATQHSYRISPVLRTPFRREGSLFPCEAGCRLRLRVLEAGLSPSESQAHPLACGAWQQPAHTMSGPGVPCATLGWDGRRLGRVWRARHEYLGGSAAHGHGTPGPFGVSPKSRRVASGCGNGDGASVRRRSKYVDYVPDRPWGCRPTRPNPGTRHVCKRGICLLNTDRHMQARTLPTMGSLGTEGAS